MPWSTANEDLVELFETTGQVELAEILFDGTRSKGVGVVHFAQVAEAETAIGMSFPLPPGAVYFNDLTCYAAKFQQYMYGGRPLDVGIRLRRRLPRAGKRSPFRRTGCEVSDSFYFSIVLAAYFSKIKPFCRSNSLSCVVVTVPSNFGKGIFCTYAPFVAPSLKGGR